MKPREMKPKEIKPRDKANADLLVKLINDKQFGQADTAINRENGPDLLKVIKYSATKPDLGTMKNLIMYCKYCSNQPPEAGNKNRDTAIGYAVYGAILCGEMEEMNELLKNNPKGVELGVWDGAEHGGYFEDAEKFTKLLTLINNKELRGKLVEWARDDLKEPIKPIVETAAKIRKMIKNYDMTYEQAYSFVKANAEKQTLQGFFDSFNRLHIEKNLSKDIFIAIAAEMSGLTQKQTSDIFEKYRTGLFDKLLIHRLEKEINFFSPYKKQAKALLKEWEKGKSEFKTALTTVKTDNPEFYEKVIERKHVDSTDLKSLITHWSNEIKNKYSNDKNIINAWTKLCDHLWKLTSHNNEKAQIIIDKLNDRNKQLPDLIATLIDDKRLQKQRNFKFFDKTIESLGADTKNIRGDTKTVAFLKELDDSIRRYSLGPKALNTTK